MSVPVSGFRKYQVSKTSRKALGIRGKNNYKQRLKENQSVGHIFRYKILEEEDKDDVDQSSQEVAIVPDSLQSLNKLPVRFH